MSRKLIKTINGTYNTQVKVYRDSEWGEFQVVVPGQPDATYHTDDKSDALSTAAVMLADLEIGARDAAYTAAKHLMSLGCEPRSAIKQAGVDAGVPEGVALGEFVGWAEGKLYATQPNQGA